MKNKQGNDRFSVDVEIDQNTGHVIRETWRNSSGQVDRLGDRPAMSTYCPTTGVTVGQTWFCNGKQHRDNDKPAILRFDAATGNETLRAYWIDDRPHRLGDAPAAIYSSASGSVMSEQFALFGMFHRTNGPAKIDYDEHTGDVTLTEYWVNDQKVEPF